MILDHLKNGEEDIEFQITSGKFKKLNVDEIPADAEVNDFLGKFQKDEVSIKELLMRQTIE